jgi:membrane-bound ClpP family serine protease
MGANSQQGWALLLFIVGFTFLPAGLFSLGPLFSILGLVCLIASAVWCYRIKPLEHGEPASTLEPVSKPLKARQAL